MGGLVRTIFLQFVLGEDVKEIILFFCFRVPKSGNVAVPGILQVDSEPSVIQLCMACVHSTQHIQ